MNLSIDLKVNGYAWKIFLPFCKIRQHLQIRICLPGTWKIVVIDASRCCCHMGKEQRVGAFVYFGNMSSFLETAVL